MHDRQQTAQPGFDSPLAPANPGRRRKRAVPAMIRMAGAWFNLQSVIDRQAAARQLAGLWFRVYKPRPRSWVHRFWSQAERRVEVHLRDYSLPVYLWGQGPLLVCLHGWSGTGTQFRTMLPQLVEAGYQVALLDTPAHGLNPGRYSHLLDFSESLLAIEGRLGPVDTVIAHSFGAMATMMAVYQGLHTERMVLLAPGMDVTAIFQNYCDAMKLNQKLVLDFHRKVGEKMSTITGLTDPWRFFRTERMLKFASERGLLIYDRQDEELSTQSFEAIIDAWPGLDSRVTEGLGHYRLLKDRQVMLSIVQWLKNES